KSNGWCDIGYNFLVDRFGRTWEGRYGGIARPVIGAHTGGFNTDSFGTAMIGTYTALVPSSATQNAVARLLAWKLGLHHADPLGRAVLVSAGGPNTVYPAGRAVSFNVVSGHRDVGNTTCPGNAAYGRLPAIRSAARAATGAALFNPASSARSRPWAGSSMTVTARVPRTQAWRLDVMRSADLGVVRTLTGTASSSLAATFDLKDGSGAWLPPGGYTLRLTSTAGGNAAVPWSAPFDITTTPSAPPVAGMPARAASGFVPVAPVRVLDTRTGLGSAAGPGALQPQGRVEVGVLGRGQVPSSGVSAVVVNLTGTAQDRATYLSAYPAEEPWPGTTSMDLAAGQTHATTVSLVLGASGRLSVYDRVAPADVTLDVVGYFPTTGGSGYTAVTPSRVVDTRTTRTPFGNGQVRSFAMWGKGGVPAGATAVVLNATVTGATSRGQLTVFPAGTARPAAASLTFASGEVTSNRVLAGLGNGALSVYAQAARVDVVLDVVGYVGGAGSGSLFTPVTPTRVLDTRRALGVPGTSPLPGGSTTVVAPTSWRGVPASATSVLVTLTALGATKGGWITAWDGTGSRPPVSDLTVQGGRTTNNLVLLPVSSAGSSALYDAGSSVHLVADVLGYVTPPASTG
ncbi:MAG: N-acetylmuramoyl-L-alanine amidase, partial [Nocardioidaceae bacterium]